jgi:hypothetical protein
MGAIAAPIVEDVQRVPAACNNTASLWILYHASGWSNSKRNASIHSEAQYGLISSAVSEGVSGVAFDRDAVKHR